MSSSTIEQMMGKRVTSGGTTNVYVRSGNTVEATHISLKPGLWLVTAWANFNSTTTAGYRAITVSETSASDTPILNSSRIMFAPSSYGARRTLSFFLSLDSTTTIYENVYQNSADDFNVNVWGITAIRIK